MTKRRTAIYCSLMTIIILTIKILLHCKLNISDDDFTNVDLCPACYGTTMCPHFFHGDIELIGTSKLKYFINSKNVYYGKFNKDRVILKKLAHDWEFIERDSLICKKVNLITNCDVKVGIKILVRNYTFIDSLRYTLNSFDSLTDVSYCSSKRLLIYMINKKNQLEGTHFNSAHREYHLHKIGEMMYSLIVNPEAVILQAFPQEEGWPFPQYYGACGRIIVEEYVGKTIAYFEDSDWKQRIIIVYQLLLIAQILTENDSGFALYMTDVNIDNFAVKPDGTVLLIDLENIVIVDHYKENGKKFLGELHHSDGKLCMDCLNFSFDDLCNYNKSDHNYYAICKGFLIPGSYQSAKGFLHSIPQEVESTTNISTLAKECANPSNLYGRFQVVPKLLQALKLLM